MFWNTFNFVLDKIVTRSISAFYLYWPLMTYYKCSKITWWWLMIHDKNITYSYSLQCAIIISLLLFRRVFVHQEIKSGNKIVLSAPFTWSDHAFSNHRNHHYLCQHLCHYYRHCHHRRRRHHLCRYRRGRRRRRYHRRHFHPCLLTNPQMTLSHQV